MHKLTSRQAEILGYIKDYLQDTGFPPTRLEIAQEMGFKSPNAAEEHLRALARKGAIEMLPGTSRGIRLPISEQLGLPIIGQVAAGNPILAEESIADYCDVPPDMFNPKADYLLTVTVKRLETSRSIYKLNLVAENSEFDPIEVDLRSSNFAIEGISVGVIRRGV